jgi:hypothetical protein
LRILKGTLAKTNLGTRRSDSIEIRQNATACGTSGSIPTTSIRQIRLSTLWLFSLCFAGITTELDATYTYRTCLLYLLEIVEMRERLYRCYRTLSSEKAGGSYAARYYRSFLHPA